MNIKTTREEEYLNLIQKSFLDFLRKREGRRYLLREDQIIKTIELSTQAQKKAEGENHGGQGKLGGVASLMI